jgi:hypothetical protein
VRICAVLQYAFLVGFPPLYAQSFWTIGPVAPDRTYFASRRARVRRIQKEHPVRLQIRKILQGAYQ